MSQKNNGAPACIGIIMDGNRRWAKARGLPTFEGHRSGYEKMKEVTRWARDAGVSSLIYFALSTENWNRSKEEVSYLLDLFRKILREDIEELRREGASVHFVGDLLRFPDDLQDMMREVHESNDPRAAFQLGIAASYGGRAEIVAAAQRILDEGKAPVTEEEFASKCWTSDFEDPDIIIRTGGEKRLSGFLTWSSVYSELFFIDPYWPDFSKEDLEKILNDYAQRERRHGR